VHRLAHCRARLSGRHPHSAVASQLNCRRQCADLSEQLYTSEALMTLDHHRESAMASGQRGTSAQSNRVCELHTQCGAFRRTTTQRSSAPVSRPAQIVCQDMPYVGSERQSIQPAAGVIA
jgi:hypothetical protein